MKYQNYILPIVALFIVGTWTYTHAQNSGIITACANKNGLLFLESSSTPPCIKGSTKISWNISGEQGPKGDPGEKGDKGDTGPAGHGGNGQLHLYDANNQDLGILMYWPTAYSIPTDVFIPDLGAFASLNVQYDADNLQYLKVGDTLDISYTGSNCTGEAFYANPVPLRVISDAQGNYFVPNNDRPITRTKLSHNNGECRETDPEPTANTYLLNKVDLPFSEPILKPLRVALP